MLLFYLAGCVVSATVYLVSFIPLTTVPAAQLAIAITLHIAALACAVGFGFLIELELRATRPVHRLHHHRTPSHPPNTPAVSRQGSALRV